MEIVDDVLVEQRDDQNWLISITTPSGKIVTYRFLQTQKYAEEWVAYKNLTNQGHLFYFAHKIDF